MAEPQEIEKEDAAPSVQIQNLEQPGPGFNVVSAPQNSVAVSEGTRWQTGCSWLWQPVTPEAVAEERYQSKHRL